MRRYAPFVLAILLLALVVTACSNGNAPGVSSSTTQSGSAISIKDNALNPPALETPVGTQVRWANNDTVEHHLVADDGTFDSGVLAEGRAFRFTFNKAGTVKYHCSLHPGETGSVVVK